MRRIHPKPEPVPFLRSRAVAALACLVAVAASPPVAHADDAAPRAVVGEREQKLGTVAPGEPVVATFRIENAGGAPLTLEPKNPVPFIAGVESSVGGAPVPPGGTGTVSIRIRSDKLSGPGTVVVPVATNDPAAAKLELRVTVEVKPLLFADPGYARYNVVQHEREGTITQKVWSSDGAAFRVLSVEAPLAALRTKFREATDEERRAEVAGSQWRVETTLAADAPVGALTGDVVIVTDHPRQKKLYVPLSGFVRPVIAITPPEAELGDVDASRPFRFMLDVKSFASEAITVERAECDLKGATVEIVPVLEGRAWKVRVSVPEGLPAGPVSGTVRIFTASAKVPRIDVPVRGRLVAKTSAPADGK